MNFKQYRELITIINKVLYSLEEAQQHEHDGFRASLLTMMREIRDSVNRVAGNDVVEHYEVSNRVAEMNDIFYNGQ